MVEKRVVVRIVGGLGNQMFQYAAGLGLAMHHGAKLELDLSAFSNYTTWPYQLDRLCVPQDITCEQSQEPLGRRRFLTRLRSRAFRKMESKANYYREPHFHFDESFFKLNDKEMRIFGYFQSPSYFENCSDMLLKYFQPATPLGAIAQKWADRIDAANCSVSLHVRRGDYVTNLNAAAVHNAIGEGYYKRAIALMRRIFGDVQFFIFSDDSAFVEQMFGDLPRACIVRTDPARSWEDMFLMARCRHHIIANSSYSWWGAWLNASPDKLVIAPGRWFTRQRLSTTNVMDIFPEGWIILK